MQRVQSSGNVASNGRPKKEKRFTYVFGDSADEMHCSGVNSLAVSELISTRGSASAARYLFSASRDGTVKRWQVEGQSGHFSGSLESHTDWVNDLAFVGHGQLLISCSSDKTLKAWDVSSTGDCLATFSKHSDYVTSLATASKQLGMVASGGLGGEVFIWDIDAAMAPIASALPVQPDHSASWHPVKADRLGDARAGAGRGPAGRQNGGVGEGNKVESSPRAEYSPLGAIGHKESVYSVGMNETGTVLVSGGTDKALRVWDPRTGSKRWKLRGHTDNVRAILVDPTGRFCVSGSSDSIIRLWDIGQQRCVHSYAIHIDSVWAMAANFSSGSGAIVYSGGRDGSIYATDLSTHSSVHFAKEEGPVLCLALQPGSSADVAPRLWAGTTNSSIHKYTATSPEDGHHLERRTPRGRSLLEGQHMQPVHSGPELVIRGSPALVQHSILNDKRRVLTKDSEGTVKLWEATNGSLIHNFGQVSFEDKLKELFEMISVPSWFTADTRLGSLSIHLDTPHCFNAEVYALDCGAQTLPEDNKVNLGHQTLHGILQPWLLSQKAAQNGTVPMDPNPNPPATSPAPNGDLAASPVSSPDSQPASQPAPSHPAILPAFQFSQSRPPSIICEGGQGGPWRQNVAEVSASKSAADFPSWVVDAVVHSKLNHREPSRCSFYLTPYESSDLPPVSNMKLSAPQILKIYKVKSYVSERVGCTLSEGDRPQQEGVESETTASHGGGRSRTFDILCNDEVLPPEMSLATVKAYIWKKPDDLVLLYRYSERSKSDT